MTGTARCLSPARYLATLLYIAVLAAGVLPAICALGGCAGIVGPTVDQNDGSQNTANNPLNVSRIHEGDTNWANVFEGPQSTVRLPGGGLISKQGQVTNDATIQFKNGTAATVTFAQDVAGKGFEFTPEGGLKIAEFGGNSTAPLNAYALVRQESTKILATLTPAQQDVYNKATQAYVDSIKELGPLVVQMVKAGLGVP